MNSCQSWIEVAGYQMADAGDCYLVIPAATEVVEMLFGSAHGVLRLENIFSIEVSHLPTKRTLAMIGIRSSKLFYRYDLYLEGGIEALQNRYPMTKSIWNCVSNDRREQIIDFALENEV